MVLGSVSVIVNTKCAIFTAPAQLARGAKRDAAMVDFVRDAIFKILKPLKDRDNFSRREAERIEDEVAESVSFAF